MKEGRVVIPRERIRYAKLGEGRLAEGFLYLLYTALEPKRTPHFNPTKL
jgi:hypothetical protein